MSFAILNESDFVITLSVNKHMDTLICVMLYDMDLYSRFINITGFGKEQMS